jgi:transmembrane sensor
MDYREYEAEDFLLDPSFRDFCLGRDENAVIFWLQWMADNPEKCNSVRQAKQLYTLLNGNHTAVDFAADEKAFRVRFEEYLGERPFEEEDAGSFDIPEERRVRTRPNEGRSLGEVLSGSAVVGQDSNEAEERRESARRGKTTKKRFYAGAVTAAFMISCLTLWLTRQIPTHSPIAGKTISKGYVQISKPGERKSFQLPDGSKVMLNAGSTLGIPTDFNHSGRDIYLEGEAYFDVTKDAQKPFTIHTSRMDIKVLGTAFNIKAYPGDALAEASLLTGSVEVLVKDRQHTKFILRPREKIVVPNSGEIFGQANSIFAGPDSVFAEIDSTFAQIDSTFARPDPTGHSAGARPDPAVAGTSAHGKKRYSIQKLSRNKADSSLVEICWTENRLAFNDNSFEDIAAQLERWYNVSIRFDDEAVKHFRFTATFNKKTISQVLDALQLSRPFEYRTGEGGQIVISGRGDHGGEGK